MTKYKNLQNIKCAEDYRMTNLECILFKCDKKRFLKNVSKDLNMTKDNVFKDE